MSRLVAWADACRCLSKQQLQRAWEDRQPAVYNAIQLQMYAYSRCQWLCFTNVRKMSSAIFRLLRDTRNASMTRSREYPCRTKLLIVSSLGGAQSPAFSLLTSWFSCSPSRLGGATGATSSGRDLQSFFKFQWFEVYFEPIINIYMHAHLLLLSFTS